MNACFCGGGGGGGGGGGDGGDIGFSTIIQATCMSSRSGCFVEHKTIVVLVRNRIVWFLY